MWSMRLKEILWDVLLGGSSRLIRVMMVEWIPFGGQWVTLMLRAIKVESYGVDISSFWGIS